MTLVSEEVAPRPSLRRRHICPSCHHLALSVLDEGPSVVVCGRCGFETDDLLSLVPVVPLGIAESVLGRGRAGVARAAGFMGAVAAALWLLFRVG